MADTFEGYVVLRFKVTEASDGVHCLYCKAYNSDHPHLSSYSQRTLLVIGVPSFCSEKNLIYMFGAYGKVQRCYFANNLSSVPFLLEDHTDKRKRFISDPHLKKGYQIAYLVFNNAKTLNKVLQGISHTNDEHIMTSNDSPCISGLQKYIEEYNENIEVNREELLKSVDQYMADYDKKQEEINNKPEEADEDGWVTVTKQNRKSISHTEKTSNKILARERRKREQKELLNFYTFQVRESKKNYVKELRIKFEEDKKKVALMKASRKFKPY